MPRKFQPRFCLDCPAEIPKPLTGKRPFRCDRCRPLHREMRVAANNADYYARRRESEKKRAQEWRLRNAQRCKASTVLWREKNADRYKAIQSDWFARNRERQSEKRKQSYAENRERELEGMRRWKAENPGKIREWTEKNYARVNAYSMARYLARLRATPVWANHEAIEAFYQEARRLTRETGIPHEVDHIYPLRAKWCCGLHVENNLQVLTSAENKSKSTRRPTGASALRECVY